MQLNFTHPVYDAFKIFNLGSLQEQPCVAQGKTMVFPGRWTQQFLSLCWKLVLTTYALGFFVKQPVKRHSRKSLRVLGSVGEPINPSAWRQEAIHCIFLYLFCLSLQNVLLKLYLSICILHDEASYFQVIYVYFRCRHSQRSHF